MFLFLICFQCTLLNIFSAYRNIMDKKEKHYHSQKSSVSFAIQVFIEQVKHAVFFLSIIILIKSFSPCPFLHDRRLFSSLEAIKVIF